MLNHRRLQKYNSKEDCYFLYNLCDHHNIQCLGDIYNMSL